MSPVEFIPNYHNITCSICSKYEFWSHWNARCFQVTDTSSSYMKSRSSSWYNSNPIGPHYAEKTGKEFHAPVFFSSSSCKDLFFRIYVQPNAIKLEFMKEDDPIFWHFPPCHYA